MRWARTCRPSPTSFVPVFAFSVQFVQFVSVRIHICWCQPERLLPFWPGPRDSGINNSEIRIEQIERTETEKSFVGNITPVQAMSVSHLSHDIEATVSTPGSPDP